MSVNNVGDHRDQYCYCAILAGFTTLATTLVKPRVVLESIKKIKSHITTTTQVGIIFWLCVICQIFCLKLH